MARTLDPSIIRGLRVAATLAAAAPVHVRLGDGQRTLLEVRRPPLPDSADHAVVPPCWFRSMVRHAHLGLAAGRGTIMARLTESGTLTVDVALAHAGMTLPGGILRIDHARAWTYLFATTLGIDMACREADHGGTLSAVAGGGPVDIRYLQDKATAVTLVRISWPVGDEPTRQLEVVHTVLARCAVAELCSEFEQPPGGAWGRR